MASEELAYCSATELLELIAAGQVSPVELTELYCERIDRLDPQLNSYLLLTRDSAMEAAREAEAAVVRGDELGPLHGLPIPIRANCEDCNSAANQGHVGSFTCGTGGRARESHSLSNSYQTGRYWTFLLRLCTFRFCPWGEFAAPSRRGQVIPASVSVESAYLPA